MLARAVDDDGVVAWRAPPARDRDGRSPSQIVAGERSGLPGDLRRRASGDHLPTMPARAGAEVNHIVRGGDHVEVMLDDEDGVAEVAQAAQDADQALGVALVQPDGRLVEDVEHAAQLGAEQRRQAQPLRLASGERRRPALQRQVASADLDQPSDAYMQAGQDGFGDEPLIRAENSGKTVQPGAQRFEREMRERDDGLSVDGHGPAFGAQARAFAVGAGLGDQKVFQLVAVAGLSGMRADVVGVAPQEASGDALEAPSTDGSRWLDGGEVAAKARALHAEEQQVALGRRVVLDRQREVPGEAVVRRGRPQDGGVIVDLKGVPARDGASRTLLRSSTSRLMSASWTLPSPVQVGQAPSGLLKEKCAMLISGTGAPQCGQGNVSSRAPPSVPASLSQSASDTSNEGGTSFPQVGQGRWPGERRARAGRCRRRWPCRRWSAGCGW